MFTPRRAGLASFLTVSFLGLSFSAYASPPPPLSRGDVEGIVKEYIQNHPEVLMQALQHYQDKQKAEAAVQAQKTLVERKKDIFHDATAPVAGNPKGDVTIVEFFDYHCGYCKKMVPAVSKLITEDKKLRVVFKEYPILAPDSSLAARASLAVWRLKPEKYFAYHTALMDHKGGFDEAMLVEEAKKIGIDEDAFKKEMARPELNDVLQKNQELASAINVHGTPAFIVGDQLIGGATSYENLKKQVEDARQKKAG
ncbi:MAG: thioredoxin domain-containing protein [Alphaproteobacteria bacterium]|nr:thioredoxin domain-containing protein [Alphaproteobacteria bacterium]